MFRTCKSVDVSGAESEDFEPRRKKGSGKVGGSNLMMGSLPPWSDSFIIQEGW